MTEFKGTPGPWSTDKYGLCVDSNGNAVQFCSLTLAGIAIDEYRANDKLVIAAPELLEALQAMLSKAYKQNWNDQYPDEVLKAQAAISKATGA
jgi:hypothetical protein